MNCKSLSTKSSNIKTGMTQNSSITAKFRRLKIQEGIILNNLNTHSTLGNQQTTEISVCDDVDYSKFVSKIKKTFIGLKNLFEEVKASTHSQETLKVVDIDDIKTNVFELENNIRSFKKYSQSEMEKLKSAEIDLAEAINEKSADLINVRKQTKMHVKPYSKIIPSPVKDFMNSPFKCSEVQQFQEFMLNSQNRYGGWNEFYHNIFVKTWHEHFAPTDTENQETNDDDPDKFNLFLQELLHKLQGFTKEEIVSHHKWYSKYIYLKERQQRAIDKWKLNRMKLKKKPLTDKTTNGSSKAEMGLPINVRSNNINNIVSDELKHIDMVLSDQVIKSFNDISSENAIHTKNIPTHQIVNKNSEFGLKFLQPTEQWNNRCRNYLKVSSMCANNDLENIQKLRKPSWRLGL